jgi:twitching motility protein PilJ
MKLYEETRSQAGAILGNLQGLVSAREAQAAIIADSEPLRRALEDLQASCPRKPVWVPVRAGLALADLRVCSLLLCAVGLAYVQLQDSRSARWLPNSSNSKPSGQEQEAKRVNDANQAAILRLMNELQTVAEGDLTQEATVTEDITGAIADSVNYTVEEVAPAGGQRAEHGDPGGPDDGAGGNTSTELLAASTEQLREIRETGQSVLDMAARINQVSDRRRNRPGGAPVAAWPPSLACGRAERDRRYELHPRPDPGNVQADQAAGRIVAGDR